MLKVAVCYEREAEMQDIRDAFQELLKAQHKKAVLIPYINRESFMLSLDQDSYDLVIVAFEGANGMETVYHLRQLQPYAKIIWISEDTMFAFQSYRSHVTRFLTKPLDHEKLKEAILTAMQDGNSVCKQS